MGFLQLVNILVRDYLEEALTALRSSSDKSKSALRNALILSTVLFVLCWNSGSSSWLKVYSSQLSNAKAYLTYVEHFYPCKSSDAEPGPLADSRYDRPYSEIREASFRAPSFGLVTYSSGKDADKLRKFVERLRFTSAHGTQYKFASESESKMAGKLADTIEGGRRYVESNFGKYSVFDCSVQGYVVGRIDRSENNSAAELLRASRDRVPLLGVEFEFADRSFVFGVALVVVLAYLIQSMYSEQRVLREFSEVSRQHITPDFRQEVSLRVSLAAVALGVSRGSGASNSADKNDSEKMSSVEVWRLASWVIPVALLWILILGVLWLTVNQFFSDAVWLMKANQERVQFLVYAGWVSLLVVLVQLIIIACLRLFSLRAWADILESYSKE